MELHGHTIFEVNTMLKHKTYFLVLLTVLFAMSGTLVWLYFFDDMPKKSPTRARQVMLLDSSIIGSAAEQTIIKQ